MVILSLVIAMYSGDIKDVIQLSGAVLSPIVIYDYLNNQKFTKMCLSVPCLYFIHYLKDVAD